MKCLYCEKEAVHDFTCNGDDCLKQKLEQLKTNSDLFLADGKFIEILRDPNFFANCCDEVNKKVAGEEQTIRTLFLCMAGRLVTNNQPASYNLLVNSESGAGKDFVTERTLQMIPKADGIKRTRISPTTFTYWHNAKFEPEWTWNGKVCYLEDVSNNLLNHEVFKVMASSGSHATVTIDQRAIDIEINGKPVIIVTSASVVPNTELARRLCPLKLDESQTQTNAILRKQAEVAMTGHNADYDEDLIEAQRFLKLVKVRVPYAEGLISIFENKSLIVRTHFRRFIDLIAASAAFNQYQREKDEEGFIIANGHDYNIARMALVNLTTNSSMIPLTKDQQRLLVIMEKNFGTTLTKVTDIEAKVTFLEYVWLREQLNRLAEYGFLEKDTIEEAVSKPDEEYVRVKKFIGYKWTPSNLVEIPTWSDIYTVIYTIPEKALNTVSRFSGISRYMSAPKCCCRLCEMTKVVKKDKINEMNETTLQGYTSPKEPYD